MKGRCACPWCTNDTDHLRLKHCMKSVYMGHKRWLEPSHAYRSMCVAFNGEVEDRFPPLILSGFDVLKEVVNLNT